MKLGAIVEGHGEVEALPCLIRRVVTEQNLPSVEMPAPLRLPKGKMKKADELARAVELMVRKTAPDGGVLVLLDADEECPAELAPRLLAGVSRADRRIRVVVAKPEFEAWFVAAAESLRGKRGLPDDLVGPTEPEAIRNPKAWLGDRMPNGYSETLDQPAFASLFDLALASRAPSFAKLLRDLRVLVGLEPG